MKNITFKITNSIISKLEYRVWWVIENAHIVSERQAKLKQIARLRSGVCSTKIECNRKSLMHKLKNFLLEKKSKPDQETKKELKNYMKILDYIEPREFDNTITEKDIFKIHQLTTKNILDPVHHNRRRN